MKTTYRVEVRHLRVWSVYVETSGSREDAEELACDISEEDLGEPRFQDWDAGIEHKYNSKEEIPKGTPIYPSAWMKKDV
jgi:hypothetical protein